ncbi:MMPL family transporter [Thiomicrorhabdus sp. Kp2]|uniref:MMPL family transporter n=1 Tax=Thiomicrorhabdus sp. Kp2 TaxID=1123518 RepID=UPI0003F7754D|nr:MMPL family transporter [Thiomicrorhabdus sp. Kp2]
MGNWAFSWVQMMAHNKTKLLLVWGVLSLLILSGITFLDFMPIHNDLLLLITSLLVMGLVVGYLLESVKVGFLQLGLSLYIVLVTFGALGWLGSQLTNESILGLVVLITLLSSNLVHILSTLLREMARGLFQYDAVAEALKLNSTPIFLSNLTTALGFVFAAWFDSSYLALAWLVVIGVTFSYLMTLSWLPMILLNWMLEFRVGNPTDRHGLTFIANWLQKNRKARAVIIVFGVLIGLGLIWVNWRVLSEIEQIFWLLWVFVGLFWLFWKSLSLALLNVLVNFFSLLASVSLFILLMGEMHWAILLWMIPLGLIVDDGIHFFSRYVRAKQYLFSDSQSAVIFAMASVGRPIWITSWVLFTGIASLLFSQNDTVFQASLLTLVSLVLATFMMLTVLPALLMSGNKKYLKNK